MSAEGVSSSTIWSSTISIIFQNNHCNIIKLNLKWDIFSLKLNFMILYVFKYCHPSINCANKKYIYFYWRFCLVLCIILGNQNHHCSSFEALSLIQYQQWFIDSPLWKGNYGVVQFISDAIYYIRNSMSFTFVAFLQRMSGQLLSLLFNQHCVVFLNLFS